MEIVLNKDKINAVFILEDAEDRITWFKEIFDFVERPFVFITKKPEEAILWLDGIKFDIIFLDHDLDIDLALSDKDVPYEETGLIVAEHIKNTINKETDCIIHSMNPSGAANMVLAHPFNTTHIPFSMLRDSLEIR